MTAVYKRELRSFFTSMTGWIVIAFLLLMTGIFSISLNFHGGYPQFEYSFNSLFFVMLFVVPLLTMRSLAEERHQRTDLLLYALPMSMTQVILGKYLATVTVFAMPVAIMGLYPLILSLYGTVNLLGTYSALFGFFLMGAALIAIGLFMSSLTENQLVAAVLSFAAMLFCYLMTGIAGMIPNTAIASFCCFTVVILLITFLIYYNTKNTVFSFSLGAALELGMLALYLPDSSRFANLFPKVLGWLSLFDRMNTFLYSGLFDLTSVVYYLSIAVLFLFFTVQSMDKRRWA